MDDCKMKENERNVRDCRRRCYPDSIVGHHRGTRRRSLLKCFAPASLPRRLKRRGADADGRRIHYRHVAAAHSPSPPLPLTANKQTLNIYSGMPPNMCPRDVRTCGLVKDRRRDPSSSTQFLGTTSIRRSKNFTFRRIFFRNNVCA